MSAPEADSAEERIIERQRRVRFADLDEFFFARVLLGLLDRPIDHANAVVELTLNRVFTTHRSPAEAEAAADVSFDYSHRIVEELADVLSALCGRNLQPQRTSTSAREHYFNLLRTKLRFLRDGDGLAVPPTIDSFQEPEPGRFSIAFDAARLRASISENLEKRLTIATRFATAVASRTPDVGFRIDFRKELDLLSDFLDARQAITGEHEFDFTSRAMPFRHAVTTLADGAAMAAPATCGPAERVLLPIYLEISGLLDITHVGIVSSPARPDDVHVKYSVRRPAHANIFGAAHQGLSPEDRRRLSDIELSIYDRIHRYFRDRYVFAGRPELETSFGALAAWLLRKVGYCLEEPSFFGKPALKWLADNAGAQRQRMEDEFFLPALQERLHGSFGDRIRRQPGMFAGKPDLLFDSIPIELKVRRGAKAPLAAAVDDSYAPVLQASAYAAKTRLAIVVVLDLPDDDTPAYSTNLDNCVVPFERDAGGDFPTCGVIFSFHCHHPTPSGFR